MQAVAEYHRGGDALLLVLLLYGRAGEPEEQRVGKARAYVLQHGAEGRPVALVEDEHDPLVCHAVELGLRDAALAGLHVAHLLYRRDDERVLGVVALHQLVAQHVGVLGGLHVVGVVGERAVLLEGLAAQLNAVHQEDHLVGVLRIRHQLRRLERRHRLARAGRVPDVAAGPPRHARRSRRVPVAGAHAVRNRARRVVLVAAQHLQAPVSRIGHGVEADHLVRHRDGQKLRHEGFPAVGAGVLVRAVGLVVEVGPVEVVARVELARTGVGEVHRVVGVHGHEQLNQPKYAGEHALVGVLLNLVAGLARRHAAALELYVDERHAVDEQAQIAPPVV